MWKVFTFIFVIIYAEYSLTKSVNQVNSECEPNYDLIHISVDISNQLSSGNYQKELDFLMHDFLELWEFKSSLTLQMYSSSVKVYDIYTSRDIQSINPGDIQRIINETKQTNTEPLFCNILENILFNPYSDENPISFIVFISKFDADTVNTNVCLAYIQLIAQFVKWHFTFVNMDQIKVNDTILLHHFPNSTIVQWDINNENEPDSFETYFWNPYKCFLNLPHTTTHTTTTNSPSTTRSSFDHDAYYKNQLMLRNNEDRIDAYFGVCILFFSITVLILIVCVCIMIYREKKQNRKKFFNVLLSKFSTKLNAYYIKRVQDPWSIPKENVIVYYDKPLGSGAFSNVFKGTLIGNSALKNIHKDSVYFSHLNDCEVAVKIPTPMTAASAEFKEAFDRELEFMKSLKYHCNLVCLLAYISDAVSPSLILELCSNGDLLRFLRLQKRNIAEGKEDGVGSNKLLSFAFQISNGLNYFTSLGYVHRDISARNILLDSNFTCKIGDFGLCRTTDFEIYTASTGKIPIRWTAIEALKSQTFSMKTDVWSYSIVLYELFSFGNVPYADKKNDQILSYIDSGKRLEQPTLCPTEIYELMVDCWQPNSDERPTFDEICQKLTKILDENNVSYNYVIPIETVDESAPDHNSSVSVEIVAENNNPSIV